MYLLHVCLVELFEARNQVLFIDQLEVHCNSHLKDNFVVLSMNDLDLNAWGNEVVVSDLRWCPIGEQTRHCMGLDIVEDATRSPGCVVTKDEFPVNITVGGIACELGKRNLKYILNWAMEYGSKKTKKPWMILYKTVPWGPGMPIGHWRLLSWRWLNWWLGMWRKTLWLRMY